MSEEAVTIGATKTSPSRRFRVPVKVSGKAVAVIAALAVGGGLMGVGAAGQHGAVAPKTASAVVAPSPFEGISVHVTDPQIYGNAGQQFTEHYTIDDPQGKLAKNEVTITLASLDTGAINGWFTDNHYIQSQVCTPASNLGIPTEYQCEITSSLGIADTLMVRKGDYYVFTAIPAGQETGSGYPTVFKQMGGFGLHCDGPQC